ncbi:Maf family protein, partial [Bacillus cereus group sp. BC17]|uniref:Maf family protein n=1 Tax=Bacillus cereus group sp. BC17 TaxID=3445345 RepID=UPI003F6987F8
KAGKHTCFTFCGQSLKLASAQRRTTPDDSPIQPTMPDTACRPPRLILASSSRYRRALLERLGVPFDVVSPDLDETPHDGDTPAATALRLAGA